MSNNKIIQLIENGLIPFQKKSESRGHPVNIHDRMKALKVPGISILIIKDFEIKFKLCYGKTGVDTKPNVGKNSIFHACSISKFITALAILKMVEKGLIDLDEAINNKLTSWKFPENKFTQDIKITLRHLLSHQAGIIDSSDSFDILKKPFPYPLNLDVIQGRTSYHAQEIRAQNVPGTTFQYSDGGFCIIEQLIVDEFKKPFNEIIKSEIFAPLGIEESFYHIPTKKYQYSEAVCGYDQSGNKIENDRPIYPYMAAAGLWTTPSHLGKIILDFMESLQGKGKIISDPIIAKEMVSPQGCFADVGLGIFIDSERTETMMISNGWGVGFQCNFIAFPESGTACVIMMNMDPGKSQQESIIGEIYRSIGKTLKLNGF